MPSRSFGARRRRPLAEAMLNLRTAGWLARRLWRPALSESVRRGRRRRR